ncbi:hypothetical protein ACFQZE_13755 [Paenibacillus sp. GCM10027627]|uniref:hypothetical protein n=1 Tax=unclassified Paenibacillus TaxID=185978 RepID=UPI00362E7C99
MKRGKAIALILFVCASILLWQDKDMMIVEMAAKEKGYFSIYIFWDEKEAGDPSFPYQLLKSLDSAEARRAMNINQFHLVSLMENNHKYDYAKILNITETPAIVVLDHQKIILETTKPEEVQRYLMGGADSDVVWLSAEQAAMEKSIADDDTNK